ADTVAIAKLIRSDDDANVLALASTQLTNEEVPAIIEAFLTTAFDGGRHQRRINKITALEHHSGFVYLLHYWQQIIWFY
ncbi:RpiB/LacA/LacB family sugar-phosphate isomerase, partial [Candidatus Gracilibacteria bacterium]|nr:RpiB/LacA/LacB family sugar-phosphate isomerase [Candidatus Gracilibacteria bacterium]